MFSQIRNAQLMPSNSIGPLDNEEVLLEKTMGKNPTAHEIPSGKHNKKLLKPWPSRNSWYFPIDSMVDLSHQFVVSPFTSLRGYVLQGDSNFLAKSAGI